MSESVNINIRLNPELREAFNKKAHGQNFSQAEVLRQLVRGYVEGRISVRTAIRTRRESV